MPSSKPEAAETPSTSLKGRRRATLRDVAAALGVSPATVSNAYNRPDQLSAELRARILDTARDLGYWGPDPTARGLRRGATDVIGVVYADRLSYAFADPAAALFLRGVSNATEALGINLLLLPAAPHPDRETSSLVHAAADGFVLYSLADDAPALGLALRRGLPAVLVDVAPRGDVPTVTIDDVGGARSACEHVLALGHRALGVLGLEFDRTRRRGLANADRQADVPFFVTRERLRGYRSAVEAAGLDWQTSTTVFECAENLPEEGYEAAMALLSTETRPTALLAMSDQLAFGALRAAADLGLQVPNDVAVVGFDDVPLAEALGLTTVAQPTFEKGRLAGKLLLARLAGEEDASPAPLSTTLIVRGSTVRAS
ncbi:LacI family DNA-binding transcriptional regulator [Deinococcus yavapaiensis]|uniref:LacI family transcriptional regulator n=1 Tax=Deinococcus yavapaiensis KR-236 TaxID=694435 RepID=A0A318S840_9DEIO|nr:LacI family DNA-binding transcriptional regulator [Deinococcus yavapaiensis]PYE54184.1 LacI family transcriptional regulator [Deinococcus yavapaiensis KR-236]